MSVEANYNPLEEAYKIAESRFLGNVNGAVSDKPEKYESNLYRVTKDLNMNDLADYLKYKLSEAELRLNEVNSSDNETGPTQLGAIPADRVAILKEALSNEHDPLSKRRSAILGMILDDSKSDEELSKNGDISPDMQESYRKQASYLSGLYNSLMKKDGTFRPYDISAGDR